MGGCCTERTVPHLQLHCDKEAGDSNELHILLLHAARNGQVAIHEIDGEVVGLALDTALLAYLCPHESISPSDTASVIGCMVVAYQEAGEEAFRTLQIQQALRRHVFDDDEPPCRSGKGPKSRIRTSMSQSRRTARIRGLIIG